MATTLELRVREVLVEGPHAVVLRLDLEGRRFDYEAGQAVWLGRPGHAKRIPFSIACSPGVAQATGALEFLIRTDAQGCIGAPLDPVAPGVSLSISGPIGRFTLPAPLVAPALLFVAGGVGIAPLRAMIQDVLARPVARPVMLVHSARSARDFAFAAEFDAEATAGRLRVVRFVTRAAGSAAMPWGRITRDTLEGIGLHRDTLCFVCGPDAFVRDVSADLEKLGLPPEQINREEWT